MRKDKTSAIEQSILQENKPRVALLVRLWRYVVSTAKGITLLYLGLYLALSLLRPVAAMLWGRYIDVVSAHLPGGTILPMIGLVLVYYLINIATDLLARYMEGSETIERLNVVQANRFQESVVSKLFHKLAGINPEYWEVPKLNDKIDRMMKFAGDDWNGMSRTVMVQSYAVIAKIVSVVSIAASLYAFHPLLCLIVLVTPLPILYTLMVGEKLKFKFVKDNAKIRRECDYYQNVMLRDGAKEVRTMGLYDFFFGKFKKRMDEYTVKEMRMYRTQTLLNCLNSFISSLASIGANVFAIVLMTLGRISIGALGAVMSLISTLIGDTSILVSSFAQLLSKKNEAALFYDVMDLEDQGKDGQDAGAFESLEARGVSYRYPMTENHVLTDVSLKIEKGEKVAFVGENGAGKTTFVKLLTALASPSDGELLVNGMPVGQIDSASRYDQISAVTQSPTRYTTFTVGDNVFLGDTQAQRSEARIGDAMRFAVLEADQKDTLLGKEVGGTELSGGQWQKLAIARAYYRDRSLIVLDEPTSNLDPLAESEVFERYMALGKDKTVVFVTHRISVAALAERIVVFEGGRICQDGTHEQLMSQEGPYARLYSEQAKWYNR